jgi:hypothetical protein
MRIAVIGLPLLAIFLHRDVGSQDGIHAGQMAFALRLEPFQHVALSTRKCTDALPGGMTTWVFCQNSSPISAMGASGLVGI